MASAKDLDAAKEVGANGGATVPTTTQVCCPYSPGAKVLVHNGRPSWPIPLWGRAPAKPSCWARVRATVAMGSQGSVAPSILIGRQVCCGLHHCTCKPLTVSL